MESIEEKIARYASIPRGKRPEGYVPLTKENFFDRFKPASTIKVFMEKEGVELSSPVVEMIDKCKYFIEQKDAKGLLHLMSGPEYKALSDEDARILLRSRITEGNVNLFLLLDYLDDLMDDEDDIMNESALGND